MDSRPQDPTSSSTQEANRQMCSGNEQLPPSKTTSKFSCREITTSVPGSTCLSRETSPLRSARSQPKISYSTRSLGCSTGHGLSRSRKNSSQELSPVRLTNPTTTAATQRALSVTSNPFHSAASDAALKQPISPNLFHVNPEARESSRWMTSPKPRSPQPPTLQSVLSHCASEHETTISNYRKLHAADEEKHFIREGEVEDILPLSGLRTPARGVSGTSSTLETVQEISQPNTPVSTFGTPRERQEDLMAKPTTDQDFPTEQISPKTKTLKPFIMRNENGNEFSGRSTAKQKSASAVIPNATRPGHTTSKSYMLGGLGRGKFSGEGSTRSMTVETQTVSSIPQIAVCSGGSGNGGSIRTKQSNETIRPRKDKKKAVRKLPSVTAGTASSKADIFEAKVASAVDEANSSDSEETFVYESNPPDVNDRPRRFHSRTPSATSMVSQIDQRCGVRAIMESHQSVIMKKSMKFANSYATNGPDPLISDESVKGTIRGSSGIGRGTTQHHHLNTRWVRNIGNGHYQTIDNESPLLNAATSNLPRISPRTLSRPTSPRISISRLTNNKKNSTSGTLRCDMQDSVSNERTPLISGARKNKAFRSRRYNASLRQLEHQATRRSQTFLSRYGGCLFLILFILLVMSGAIGFMYATTQPLVNLKVLSLKNIIASEQDLLFDIEARARNPNLVSVTIESTDIAVFALSKYSCCDIDKRGPPIRKLASRRSNRSRNYEVNDLLEEYTERSSIFEIGRVYSLDSPLKFEGAALFDKPEIATGQISIESPGNNTKPTVTGKWVRILHHEFDLILRGTMKYSLPLSQKIVSVTIEIRSTVQPDAGYMLSRDFEPTNDSHES
ncbi:BgTH12-00818 [Blumeria graminis f. sp. triticale]|nr:Integral vacuolar membrane protein [Blumeria graminis f. sp. tritici 96224]CAD6505327.1 BgTH12-00818 [Blumeria graminis f. sp. triticale]